MNVSTFKIIFLYLVSSVSLEHKLVRPIKKKLKTWLNNKSVEIWKSSWIKPNN